VLLKVRINQVLAWQDEMTFLIWSAETSVCRVGGVRQALMGGSCAPPPDVHSLELPSASAV